MKLNNVQSIEIKPEFNMLKFNSFLSFKKKLKSLIIHISNLHKSLWHGRKQFAIKTG